jgi:hypothetical protein
MLSEGPEPAEPVNSAEEVVEYSGIAVPSKERRYVVVDWIGHGYKRVDRVESFRDRCEQSLHGGKRLVKQLARTVEISTLGRVREPVKGAKHLDIRVEQICLGASWRAMRLVRDHRYEAANVGARTSDGGFQMIDRLEQRPWVNLLTPNRDCSLDHGVRGVSEIATPRPAEVEQGH